MATSLLTSIVAVDFIKRSIPTFAISALLMLAVLVGTPSIVRSQPPCPNDPACPWTPAVLDINAFEVAPGRLCDITIAYCYRSCNGRCEILFREWKFYDRACIQGVTLDQTFYARLFRAIAVHLMGRGNDACSQEIPPCPNSTPIFSFMRSSCVKWTVDSLVPDVVIRSCGYSALCTTENTFCYDNSTTPPNVVMNLVAVGGNNCPASSTPLSFPAIFPTTTYESPCYTTCY